MDSESTEVVHKIRDSSHCELGKYVNVLVLYTGGTIGMYGTEDGLYYQFILSLFIYVISDQHEILFYCFLYNKNQ